MPEGYKVILRARPRKAQEFTALGILEDWREHN